MSLVRFVCIVLEDKLSRTNAQSGTSLYGHPDRLQDLPCLLSLAALTYSSRLIGAIESGSQVIYWFQIETRRRGEKGWVERDKNKKSKRESSPSVDTSICSLGRLVFSGWTEVEGPIQRHPSLNFFRADDSNLVTEHKNLCTLMWWDNLAFFLLIVFLKKLGHRAKKFMLSKTNFSFCPGFLQGFHHPFFSILSQPPNWSKKKFHLWLDQPPTHPNLSLFPPPQKKTSFSFWNNIQWTKEAHHLINQSSKPTFNCLIKPFQPLPTSMTNWRLQWTNWIPRALRIWQSKKSVISWK